jgi:hypothetical protein
LSPSKKPEPPLSQGIAGLGAFLRKCEGLSTAKVRADEKKFRTDDRGIRLELSQALQVDVLVPDSATQLQVFQREKF